MPINVETLSVGQLENLIENHGKQRATDAPMYLDALRELEKRKGKGLDFDKSLSIILKAAKERRFLSYKELADASGADWGQVHYAIGPHLWKLVEYADRKGWPLLSAIVVNKPNVDTGKNGTRKFARLHCGRPRARPSRHRRRSLPPGTTRSCIRLGPEETRLTFV